MRRNFADVLKNAKIDISYEYTTLFDMVYYGVKYIPTKSYKEIVDEYFYKIPFRGTCTSLESFDYVNNFYFPNSPNNFNIDFLINFCEYWYNMARALNGNISNVSYNNYSYFIIDHIRKVIDKIGYKELYYDGFYVFVENDKAAVAVSEIIENNDYDVLYYNHHSLKGDLEGKKILLLKFANYLEPRRNELKQINPKLETQIFQLFNKMNMSHNNNDPSTKNFVPYIATMKKNEIENWYDEIYQMFLLSMLELEHLKRKPKLDELLENINK